MVTRNMPHLVIVIFSDEVVKITFLPLYLDMYLFSVVLAIDTYAEVVKKMYFLLLLLGM